MKILHVYKTFINDTVGGTQRVIASIVRNNIDERLQFSVLSLSKRKTGVDLSFSGVANIHYREHFSLASNPGSFTLLRDFGEIVKNFDLIHYHFPWPFADLMHYIWRVKKPTIVTYHSDIVRQQKLLYFYQPLMKNFLNSANILIATSQNYLNTSQILQTYKEKTLVIPIGIQRSDYPTPGIEKLAYWRERFGEQFFLFVGVMRYYKGLHILLAAMRNTSYPLVIVGSGLMESELKSYARKEKLSNVYFLGELSDEDKIALLQLSLALIFPSHLRSEAFGISLLEGAMFGKPLISAEIGTGTSYINIDGKTGIVVPPNDPVALRQAMDYIWHNPIRRNEMGFAAKHRFEKLFTARMMADEYAKVYHSLYSNNSTN